MKAKKAQLKVEEMLLEATLEAIQQEKDAEEAAVEVADIKELSGFHDTDQDLTHQSAERTGKYVQDQYAYMSTN